MPDFRLHPKTSSAAVMLTVNDLLRPLDFYQKLLGLCLHRRESGRKALSRSSAPLTSWLQGETTPPASYTYTT